MFGLMQNLLFLLKKNKHYNLGITKVCQKLINACTVPERRS